MYFNISDLFKNVCEKNNQVSKDFFYNFRPALNNSDYVGPADEIPEVDEEEPSLESPSPRRAPSRANDQSNTIIENKMPGGSAKPKSDISGRISASDLQRIKTEPSGPEEDSEEDEDPDHNEAPPKWGTF